ncbi:hypothetical protein [Cellvibrio sp. KY-YJ-3]|uniref:hypothetical protein n=1 Tax=Cellvibrio sp. KY-YJ-3 TaxID=454662 RepID=UPI00124809EF|nr:hypothetical protein [Cellvibrio sp. KY-YJ-3]QEY12133.1 hypothetical protein D0B88_07595 [Cellvibrio sp. KY-YJ-3]
MKYLAGLTILFFISNGILADEKTNLIDYGFQGTITLPSQKLLTISGNISCGNDLKISGSYKYENIGKNIELSGIALDSMFYVLNESPKSKPTGQLIYSISNDSINGKWTDFNNYYELSLTAIETNFFSGEVESSENEKFLVTRKLQSSKLETYTAIINNGIRVPITAGNRCANESFQNDQIDYFWVKKADSQYEISWRISAPFSPEKEYHCSLIVDHKGATIVGVESEICREF